MWSDNETNRDFLNFRCVADTAAEMIIQANGQPLSVGVSGGWGVGKSSMLRLISDSLKDRGDGRYLFVDFNAWLYQGFDDARAALMEVIARQLIIQGEQSSKGLDKAKALLSRVDWLRVARLTASSALSVAVGVPPLGVLSALLSAGKGLAEGSLEAESGKFPVLPTEASPPHQIQDLRKHFEETLSEMGVTLVVFIDDLDRCLPETTIATLEAIRLFLFLPQTAFIIAADDRMIRQAVRVHFHGADLDDNLVTNYFDKLVQIPLRVPPLGTQEVRAYLMLLFVENGELGSEQCESIREQVCQQLSDSWRGSRVDLHFVLGLIGDCPESLRANLELADRLAPLMTTASQIAGNPRLVKRFLNTLSIRLAIAQAQHIAVDEGALAKMLLFERCADESAYSYLISAITNGDEGKPTFLAEWEERAIAGEDIDELPPAWTSQFIMEWLALAPAFADMDLRSVVYVSREHMPVISAADRLSSEAAGILEALLTLEGPANTVLTSKVGALSGREVTLMNERLMVRARQEQEWGTPPVFWGLLTVIEADPEQAEVFARFLESIPTPLLKPDIVPALEGRDWARAAIAKWSTNEETPGPVKVAITVMERRKS